MGWKYIMIENKIGDLTILFPIIFPDKLVHDEVYQRIRQITPGWRGGSTDVVSAGTIEHVEVLGLGGGSETLKLKANKRDEGVIENYSYLHGIL